MGTLALLNLMFFAPFQLVCGECV